MFPASAVDTNKRQAWNLPHASFIIRDWLSARPGAIRQPAAGTGVHRRVRPCPLRRFRQSGV